MSEDLLSSSFGVWLGVVVVREKGNNGCVGVELPDTGFKAALDGPGPRIPLPRVGDGLYIVAGCIVGGVIEEALWVKLNTFGGLFSLPLVNADGVPNMFFSFCFAVSLSELDFGSVKIKKI